MAAPAAATGVAATAEDATAGVAVPEKTGNEAVVDVEGEPDSTGGLISKFLGGMDEGTAAGACTGVEVEAVGGGDAGAGAAGAGDAGAGAGAAGALSAGAIGAGAAAGVDAGTAAG